jgi:hypothetical protein
MSTIGKPISVPAHASTTVGFRSPIAGARDAPSNPLPRQYLNQTYGGTYRRINGKWENLDNKTGRVLRVDVEVSRTETAVELFSPSRNVAFRLLPTHIEQKINGKWQRVATGHWETNSEPASASEQSGSAPQTLFDRFAGRWRILAENGSSEFVLTLDPSLVRNSRLQRVSIMWVGVV